MNKATEELIRKTQPMVDAREREYAREAEQDAAAPESTVAGMVWALEVLLAAYTGDRK